MDCLPLLHEIEYLTLELEKLHAEMEAHPKDNELEYIGYLKLKAAVLSTRIKKMKAEALLAQVMNRRLS